MNLVVVGYKCFLLSIVHIMTERTFGIRPLSLLHFNINQNFLLLLSVLWMENIFTVSLGVRGAGGDTKLQFGWFTGWPTPRVDCVNFTDAYRASNTTRPCTFIGGKPINFTAHHGLDYTAWCRYEYIYDGRLPGSMEDKLLCTAPKPNFDSDFVGWGWYDPYVYAPGLEPSFKG